MIDNFRIDLAKLLGCIALVLVVLLGMFSRISAGVIAFRALLGGIIFAALGYFMGQVIEKKREVFMIHDEMERVKAEKQRLKENVLANVTDAVMQTGAGGGVKEDDFAPLNVENLTKIIVDSLEE